MAATGPYIIYKSSQFCAAVRSNVGFDHPLRKRIQEVTFSFPINGANTLPPRLNLKSLTTAVNVICQQVRERREKFLMKRHNVKQTRRGFHSQTKESNMSCENAIADSNIRLLGAAGFLWENERITDYELYRCKKDIRLENTRKRKHEERNSDGEKEKWEKFINQKQLEVWRRPVDTTGLFEYKVFGTFFDINAMSFYRTQIDNEYRIAWDQFVLKLDVVDSDPLSGSEVLHWVTKFPYPLRSRDYVFVRRGKIDHQSMTMVSNIKGNQSPTLSR
ncbi:StAR- lipid transfer protein 7, mitochondrial [Desmophyllum pertusum]|uniref:StAR- lipid transfer protein 7, mitochondrial n=1 Tax=Desmophyllum pertusum TaxID=174260 RepID=A0A9W9ZFA2_9CNID|nr:StAR- lipid transfer protein 7, mitochondrial [Desmophyllum pertusum]